VRILVAGWFSFELMGASAGDLLVRDAVCGWLREAGLELDVAVVPPFSGGVDWRAVDPAAYSHVLFVCGPFGNGEPLTPFLERFRGLPLVGVNLTMLEPLEAWDPFDLLLERDSTRAARPDLVFLSRSPLAPVVGLVLVDSQPEYGDRDLHRTADEAIERLLGARDVAAVRIDTRLDVNATGLRTAGQVEAAIARMDAVITTRLHGMALALKNGVPAVVVDTVAGGDKVSRQAAALGWPVLLRADELDGAALESALDRCLDPETRLLAAECAARAARALEGLREQLLAAFR
jgi:hypothetical protein